MAAAEAECIGKWILRSVMSPEVLLPASGEKVAEGRMRGVEGFPSQEPLHYKDILLISWQRPRLAYYAKVFERLGIPYEITGSNAFKDVDALEKAMPFLCAVVDPEDEVSTVAFLRGPLNGADDDALYR